MCLFLLGFFSQVYAQEKISGCDTSPCNFYGITEKKIQDKIDNAVAVSIEKKVEDVKWYIDNVFALIGIILAFFGLGAIKLIYDETKFDKKMNSCFDEIKQSAIEKSEQEIKRLVDAHKSKLLNEIQCVRHRSILFTLLRDVGDNFEAQIFNSVSYLENRGSFEDRILLKSILDLQPSLKLKDETISRIRDAYDKLAKKI